MLFSNSGHISTQTTEVICARTPCIVEDSKDRKKRNTKLAASDKLKWKSTLSIYGAWQVLVLL